MVEAGCWHKVQPKSFTTKSTVQQQWTTWGQFCGKHSETFVVPVEAACNLMNCIQWCRSVTLWMNVMDSIYIKKKKKTLNQRYHLFFVQCILLPFQNLAPTLPTMQFNSEWRHRRLLIRLHAASCGITKGFISHPFYTCSGTPQDLQNT